MPKFAGVGAPSIVIIVNYCRWCWFRMAPLPSFMKSRIRPHTSLSLNAANFEIDYVF